MQNIAFRWRIDIDDDNFLRRFNIDNQLSNIHPLARRRKYFMKYYVVSTGGLTPSISYIMRRWLLWIWVCNTSGFTVAYILYAANRRRMTNSWNDEVVFEVLTMSDKMDEIPTDYQMSNLRRKLSDYGLSRLWLAMSYIPGFMAADVLLCS